MNNSGITAQRILPEKLSNGDQNTIKVEIKNKFQFPISCLVIDEIPIQFQVRDFEIKRKIAIKTIDNFTYNLRPTKRGVYQFGNLNVYVSSPLNLASKRFQFDSQAEVPNYPSFLQLRKYNLLAFSTQVYQNGIKKMRRIGQSSSFEQIKEYVQGDDLRTINWKATAKKNALMINQFQDEKAQAVYLIIDKGRTMQMPFDGLSLLDYAINSSLALANIILKKQDKVGFISFSKKIENRVVAENRFSQMQKIIENLYAVKTDFFESDYGQLLISIKKTISHRSLLLLYTNFETLEGLNRQLPYLKSIAKSHVLVVVFFQNSELNKLIDVKSESNQDIYNKIIAEKMNFEKRLIANELRKYGIFSLLTLPENLTLETINKYLEIKSRGIL